MRGIMDTPQMPASLSHHGADMTQRQLDTLTQCVVSLTRERFASGRREVTIKDFLHMQPRTFTQDQEKDIVEAAENFNDGEKFFWFVLYGREEGGLCHLPTRQVCIRVVGESTRSKRRGGAFHLDWLCEGLQGQIHLWGCDCSKRRRISEALTEWEICVGIN